MTHALAQYDALVHRIYDAALEPSHWPAVVADIAAACGGSRCLLFTPTTSPKRGGFTIPHNLSQGALERWAAKSIHEDPLVQAGLRRNLLREGNAATSVDLLSDEELHRTSFYKELWAPLDIARACFGVVFDGIDSHKRPTVLAVYRSERDGLFEPVVVDLVARLVVHLSRSLGVMYHLRDSEWKVASSQAALDRLAAGVLLLDSKGAVQFTNVAAHRVLQCGDPLALVRGVASGQLRPTLHARLKRFEADFHQAVRDALSPLEEDSPRHFSQSLVLPDAEDRPAWVVHVAPIGEHAALPAGSGDAPSRAIVILYDLGAATSVEPAVLSDLFGLTPAECRVALQVLKGGTAEEMAGRVGVAVTTFKTQLQNVYAKTNTHRQADLLKLFLALVAQ